LSYDKNTPSVFWEKQGVTTSTQSHSLWLHENN